MTLPPRPRAQHPPSGRGPRLLTSPEQRRLPGTPDSVQRGSVPTRGRIPSPMGSCGSGAEGVGNPFPCVPRGARRPSSARPALHLLGRPPRAAPARAVQPAASSYHLSWCRSSAAEGNYEIFSISSGSAHVSPGEAAIRRWQQRGAARLPSRLWKDGDGWCEPSQSSPSTGIAKNFQQKTNSANTPQPQAGQLPSRSINIKQEAAGVRLNFGHKTPGIMC